ncbi:MAG: FKBP-type peptidyl-prolyl cis-trans isomerase [Thermodesulfobacteriota bacterium]|nr:FKBP-type peptidyl-prolyl cis-trans isomerase [Thermodesulfobacteriota bacterium]
MRLANKGDMVKVHYTEKLENGRILDTSKGDQPIELKIGNNIVPLFEKAIKSMRRLETKSIKVPPEKAYGPRREELIIEVAKNKSPENISPVIGHKVKLRQPNRDNINAVITDIKKKYGNPRCKSSISRQANHF